MKILAQTLSELEIGKARTFAGLTVIPLLASRAARGERPYKTLDEALDDGTARVTEVSETGAVPELRFVNQGDEPILLLDGEEIIGAKQNRILNLTMLVPAHETIIIPVSCVEAGRWSPRSTHFRSARHVMSPLARRKKAARVSVAMARGGAPRSDQAEIWADIEALSVQHAVHSPTSEMHEVYQQRGVQLDEYVGAFPAVPRQVGAMFALGDEVRGIEVFDFDDTLRGLLPKVVRSWALDAVLLRGQPHEVPDRDSARAFLDEVARARATDHDPVGAGRAVRLFGRRLTGGALVHDERVVHLCAFRLDEGEGEGEDHGRSRRHSRMARPARRGRGNPAA